MIRLCTASVAALLALAATAQGQSRDDVVNDTGFRISFNSDIVGCINLDDAKEGLRQYTLYGQPVASDWAWRFKAPWDRKDGRGCAVLGGRYSGNNELIRYRLVRTGDDGWFCIENQIFGYGMGKKMTEAEADKRFPLDRQCWWVNMLGRSDR